MDYIPKRMSIRITEFVEEALNEIMKQRPALYETKSQAVRCAVIRLRDEIRKGNIPKGVDE